jgi:hypothetical protein
VYHYFKKKYALYTNIMCCQNKYEIGMCFINSSLTYVNSIVLANSHLVLANLSVQLNLARKFIFSG